MMEGHNCYKIHAFDRESPVITIELLEKNEGEDAEKKSREVPKGRPPKKDKKVS